MKLFSVNNFPVSIEGEQSDGWKVSDSSDSSRKVLFNFEIEELENNGGFLQLCYNSDKKIYSDT